MEANTEHRILVIQDIVSCIDQLSIILIYILCLIIISCFFLKIYFIDYVIIVISIFPPLLPFTQYPHSFQQSPLSSCPWVMHISSLACPFPILFLTPFCLFCTYQFVLLNPCNFSHILLLPPPS